MPLSNKDSGGPLIIQIMLEYTKEICKDDEKLKNITQEIFILSILK